MFLAESTVGYKRRRPDDVVVNTMWAWMSALGVARQSGLVSPSYAVCRPIPENGLLPAYVDRLLRTPEYAAEYTRSSIVHPEAHKRAEERAGAGLVP